MATSINFPTYGFINDTLALNEENWRKFFKPFVYDSVQSGLVTTAGTGMTVNISAGECRCGAVMGILDGAITLDVDNGDATYNRIDSVVIQYSYGNPSTLSVTVKKGTASANPVAPTLSKVYNTLWEMEIAQILVPSGATSSSSLTITDKRVIYESIEDAIDDIVISSSTEPTSPMNEIWFQDEPDNEYTVPTNAEFTELEQDVTDLKNSLNMTNGGMAIIGADIHYEQGGLNSSGLNTTTNPNTRVRSKDYCKLIPGQTYYVIARTKNNDNNIKVSISYYTTNDYITTRTGAFSFVQTFNVFTLPEGNPYIRILLAPQSGTDLLIDDVLGVTIYESAYNTPLVYDKDMNELVDLPCYSVSGPNRLNLPNGAPNENAILEVYKYPNTAIFQRISFTTSGYIYIRLRNTSGVWYDWKQIDNSVFSIVGTFDADINTLIDSRYYRVSGSNRINMPNDAPRTVAFLENYKMDNGAITQYLIYPSSGATYTRLYNTSGIWSEWIQTSQLPNYKVLFLSPNPSELSFNYIQKRTSVITGGVCQDIAIYNNTIFGFDVGYMYVNGEAYTITDGHGNNCNFGKTLHGDYPYLYCGSWTKDSCKIYINQITDSSATLINTLDYSSTLSGYLNCCIDEENNKAYILLCTSETTPEGVVDFIVSDLSGNIISRNTLSFLIPIIQGMKFYKNKIYVTYGNGTAEYPNTLMVLDTNGNIITQSESMSIVGEIEGIEIYGGNIYLASGAAIYKCL